MGSRNAFTFVASSSGYLKPASLYSGESYERSSFYTDEGTDTDNPFGVSAHSKYTNEGGGADGFRSFSEATSELSTSSNTDVTFGSSNSSAITSSDNTSTFSSFSSSQNQSQFTDSNTISTDSVLITRTKYDNGEEITTYSYKSGGTTTLANLRNTLLDGSSSGSTFQGNNSYSYVSSGSVNNGSISIVSATSSSALSIVSIDTIDTNGENSGYDEHRYSTSYYELLQTISDGNDVNYASGLSSTITANPNSDNQATYTTLFETRYSNEINENGGETYSLEYRYDGSTIASETQSDGGSTTFSTSEVTDYTGQTNSDEGSSSGTTLVNATGTKNVNSTGQSTREVLTAETGTSSSILGTFFDQEVTQRYTYIDYGELTDLDPTNTAEQSRYGIITTTSATEIWDNLNFDFLIDKTLSAAGGVYGFLSNNKESVENTYSTSTALSDIEDSYFLEGQSWMPLTLSVSSTRGTDTTMPSMTYPVTTRLDTTTRTFNAKINSSIEYSYYKIGTQTGSNYASNGFLDETIITRDLTTNSSSIFIDQISASDFSYFPTTTTVREVKTTPTIETTLQTIFDSSGIGTYFDGEQILTYNKYTTSSSHYTQETTVGTLIDVIGRYVSYSKTINTIKPDAFDSFNLRQNEIDAMSYRSMPFLYDEKAFCSVTNTDRQSRDKASPPDVDYKEFFLTTTVDSNSVTRYSQTTRTAEGWFIPQAQESSINGMIYFPKSENFEIVDHGTNTMSFSENNQNTQIVQVTFSTVSDGLTRSTTSQFARFLTVGSLQSRDHPKSFSYNVVNYKNPKFFGGNNEYSGEGIAYLQGYCDATAFDISGGSTVFANDESIHATSSTLTTGIVSISSPEKIVVEKAKFKNNYILTLRES